MEKVLKQDIKQNIFPKKNKTKTNGLKNKTLYLNMKAFHTNKNNTK